MIIYLVAFFKFNKNGPEDGFERLDLQTFYSNFEEACEKSKKFFCDEAGWYEGILIEERKEGNPCHKGKRIIFLQNKDGFFKESPEPNWFKHCINLIG